MMRLVCFAAISVMFSDRPELQAALGLAVLFVAILAHGKNQPYLEKELDDIEEKGLVASWLTLYGGTLLYSGGLSKPFKVVVTLATLAYVYLTFISAHIPEDST